MNGFADHFAGGRGGGVVVVELSLVGVGSFSFSRDGGLCSLLSPLLLFAHHVEAQNKQPIIATLQQ